MKKTKSKITTSSKPKKRVFSKLKAAPAKKKKSGFKPKSWDDVPKDETVIEDEKDDRLSEAARKYPPPKTGHIFRTRWNEYIDDVVARDNFRLGHLAQLSILCDLYVEYNDLKKTLRRVGYTYETIGRMGLQIKQRPEVNQLNRVRADIRNYSKTLGLLLMKDTTKNENKDAEEWD